MTAQALYSLPHTYFAATYSCTSYGAGSYSSNSSCTNGTQTASNSGGNSLLDTGAQLLPFIFIATVLIGLAIVAMAIRRPKKNTKV